MNANKPGLYSVADYADDEPGTQGAKTNAAHLVWQAAGIALVCSLALDSTADEKLDYDLGTEAVVRTTSRLMFKCWDDLMGASYLSD